MNKMLRNFWLDVLLFLLLGLDLALVGLTPRQSMGLHPSLGWHIHILISILLGLGCLVHVIWHRTWFQAVLAGKAKGKVKLVMNSLVILMILLASLSGHEAVASYAANRLHGLTGYLGLIGMVVHGLRHTPWMAMVTKRLVTGGQKNIIRSA